MAFARAGTPSNDKTPSDAALYDDERKKQAEEEAEDRRRFATRAAESPGEPDSGSGAAGSGIAGNITGEAGASRSDQPADVSVRQLEMQPAPAAGSLQLDRLHSMMNMETRPHDLHLPSGLPEVSMAFAGRRILAIDKAGELFLSEDSGATWERVKRQWSGRALMVRKHAEESGTTKATPAPETAGDIPGSGLASQPGTVFELVNDQSRVWISVDGQIWIAK
jgi:hypothetical protein